MQEEDEVAALEVGDPFLALVQSGAHANMVSELAKSGEEIRSSITTAKWSLLVEAFREGVTAGNKVDAVKKQVVYNKAATLVAAEQFNHPDMTAEQAHLIHMALGIFGEAAELMDAVFTSVGGHYELDMENVIEELGDIEFYMEGFRQGIETTREEILDENIQKLNVRRYPDGYSDQAAQERADKA